MRRENSGLIDLDALLKEASQPELPKSADSSLEVSAPPPEPPPPAPAVEPPPSPPHPSSSPLASAASPASSPASSDDSLQAITTIAEVPEPPAKPPADPLPAEPPPPSRKRPSFIPWIAIAAAVGVVAIAVGWRHPKDSGSRDAASAAEPAATPVTPTVIAPSTAGTTIPTGLSLADLPAAATAAVITSAAPIATQALRAPTAAPATTASAKLTEIAEAPPSADGDLGGAMRDAVGARASAEIAKVEAPPGEGARQLRPSPGAVVGAISSVMPAARMCLDGSEVVRNATIVFKSDGTVARVDIAGAPNVADECIRGALTNARTTPFVADTFAARATVRP